MPCPRYFFGAIDCPRQFLSSCLMVNAKKLARKRAEGLLMFGAHQFTRLVTALAIGTGIVFFMGGAAGAAESSAIGPAPFQLGLPDGAPHSLHLRTTALKAPAKAKIASLRVANARDGALGAAAASSGLFDFSSKSQLEKPGGLLGLSDGSALAHAFADIPAAPKLALSFGQGDTIQFEVAQLPIPGTVWLFLAALALLFGISRRNVASS